MKHNIRLAAIDLDGTTLRRDKTVGQDTVCAVNRALERGLEVVVCTGRSRVQCERYISLFPSMHYVITSSGAAVYDTSDGWRKIISNEIPPAVVEEILTAADGVDCFPIMSAGGKTLYTAHMAPAAVEYGLGPYTYELNTFGTGVEDLHRWYSAAPQPVESVSLYFRRGEQRYDVVKQLEHLPLYFALPAEPAVEISLNTANKGEALGRLCGMLNIPLSETMAVGDSDNDVPMLLAAGLAVVPANAPDAVKAKAHRITADCNHDCVAEALAPFLS